MIAQEAGGFVTGSKDAPHDGVVTEGILTGRRCLFIRAVAGTAVRADPPSFTWTRLKIDWTSHPSIHFIQEESSRDVQKRIAQEFYDTVEDTPRYN